MRINSENIEAFLLDYSEGNLSPDLVHELHAFILCHPEYQEMLDMADSLPVIEAEPSTLQGKTDLRRYTFASPDEAFVKEIEGELNQTEKEELEDLLKHYPHLNKERGWFALTVLQPEQINYPEKEQLKRRTGVILTLYPHILRIAALFLLTLLTGTAIYYLVSKNEGQENIALENQDNIIQNKFEKGTPEPGNTASVIPKERSGNRIAIADNSSKNRSVKIKNAADIIAATRPAMQPLEPITAHINEKEPIKLLMMSQPALLNQNLTAAASTHVNSEEYMDLYQLASKYISKVTKGKVGFNHSRNDNTVLTELAVNAGDFEFVRKKTKGAVTNE